MNSTSATYFLTTSIAAFPSLFLINKLGLSNSIKLAALFITIGFVCRVFIDTSIYIVIGGQVVAGLAGPVFLTTQTRVIAQWFDEKEVYILIFIFRGDYGLQFAPFRLLLVFS